MLKRARDQPPTLSCRGVHTSEDRSRQQVKDAGGEGLGLRFVTTRIAVPVANMPRKHADPNSLAHDCQGPLGPSIDGLTLRHAPLKKNSGGASRER